MQGHLKRSIRWGLRLSAGFLAVGLGWIGWNQASYNFAELQPGRLYRSGQMPPAALEETIRQHKIKTVLNLRGPNPSEAWYRDERNATLRSGATQIDIAMSSCQWMSRAQLRALVRTLDTCEG